MFWNPKYSKNKQMLKIILSILTYLLKFFIELLFPEKNASKDRNNYKIKNIKMLILFILIFILGLYWCSYDATNELQNLKLYSITAVMILCFKEILDNTLTEWCKKKPQLCKQTLCLAIVTILLIYIIIYNNIIGNKELAITIFTVFFSLGLAIIVSSLKKM